VKFVCRTDADEYALNDTETCIKRGPHWYLMTHGDLIYPGKFVEVWEAYVVHNLGCTLPSLDELFKIIRREHENRRSSETM